MNTRIINYKLGKNNLICFFYPNDIIAVRRRNISSLFLIGKQAALSPSSVVKE